MRGFASCFFINHRRGFRWRLPRWWRQWQRIFENEFLWINGFRNEARNAVIIVGQHKALLCQSHDTRPARRDAGISPPLEDQAYRLGRKILEDCGEMVIPRVWMHLEQVVIARSKIDRECSGY